MSDNNKKIDAFSIILSKRNLNDNVYIVPGKTNNSNYDINKFKPYNQIFKLILNDLEDILNQGFILNTNKMTCINEVSKLLENHKNNKLEIIKDSLLTKINNAININRYLNEYTTKNKLLYCSCGLNEFNINFGNNYENSLLKQIIDQLKNYQEINIDYKTIENIMKDE